jgi:hypothetical protein
VRSYTHGRVVSPLLGMRQILCVAKGPLEMIQLTSGCTHDGRGAQPSSVILQTLRAASVDQWGKTATRSNARERAGSIDQREYPH